MSLETQWASVEVTYANLNNKRNWFLTLNSRSLPHSRSLSVNFRKKKAYDIIEGGERGQHTKPS